MISTSESGNQPHGESKMATTKLATLETYRQHRAKQLRITVRKHLTYYVATSPNMLSGDYCAASSRRAARNQALREMDGSDRPH